MAKEEEFEPGKLFVGGLSWETKEDSLRKYFSHFGELSEASVKVKDSKHAGFGFITYVNPADAESVLHANFKDGHIIDGKKVDPKRATKSGQPQKVKVFIGGIPATATEEDLKAAFSGFGSIVAVDVKSDSSTMKSRGFGFVTFESEESAEKAVSIHFVPVLGKHAEVKIAENNKKSKGGRGGFHQGFGRQEMPVYGASTYYGQMAPQQQTHSGYGYSSGQGSAAYAAGYPQQWPGYEQYQAASGGGTGYYQGSSNPASSYTAAAYGNSYNSSRAEPAGATFSTPQQAQQTYSYPQQQQQQQSYATGYPGYGGGGAGRSQIQQQGYNSSFPPRQ